MNRVTAKTERGPQERKSILMTRRKTYQKGGVKLHNGSWTLRYRELDHTSGNWKPRREVLGKFKDKKDALKASEPIMARINERDNTEPQKLNAKLTFKEFVETYWKPYTVKKKQEISTIDNRYSVLNIHLLPCFGSKLMREVQPSDISKFLQGKAKDGYADNTMQGFYAVLRLMFDLAEQNDVIVKSPVRPKLHKPEKTKVEKPTLSATEIRALLQLLPNEQERVFALLLAVTGMRIGEALALRWIDFNATKSELSINHTLYRGKLKEPKTKGSKTTIRLAPQIAALLVTHQESSVFQAMSDFIFCRKDGDPLNPSVVRFHLYDAMDNAGIDRVKGKYGHHIFRHSAGTLLYAKSRDLKLVQGTLRHADISTTSDIYVHLSDKILNEGSEILATEILGSCDLPVTQEGEMAS
jgi:integrase